jgi:hypothetical protein
MAHAGRKLPLSLPRRFVGDLLHFARQVPTVPVQRSMHLAPLAAARALVQPRVSWCAVFIKAYAIVAARRPELRRAYMKFPWPHLFEHARNIASVAIGRQWQGEDAVFFAQLRCPEEQDLRLLDDHLRRWKEEPVMAVGPFRRTLRLCRWPRPWRRLQWWMGLNISGAKRAHYMGTFGVSVYGGLGAASLHPLSPLTTTLNYGAFQADGSVDVRLIYDHRVLDGATVARALEELESVLLGQVTAELRALSLAAA